MVRERRETQRKEKKEKEEKKKEKVIHVLNISLYGNPSFSKLSPNNEDEEAKDPCHRESYVLNRELDTFHHGRGVWPQN